jgi:Rps23 Pro-64 3,4-dihydroxylase Tpa1-like proline 4-hydroxylase
MELKDYIKVFDNTIEPEKIGSLIKYLNKVKFNPTSVIDQEKGNVVNKEIRNTDSWVFDDSSYSNVHWKNFLNYTLVNVYHEYRKNLDLKSQINCTDVITVEALKYEEGGFYTIHHDHHSAAPRTLSMILFLNNDYKGGELIFHGPKKETEKIRTVHPEPGRIIVWPSNFLYPHSVEKVTKGTRYTVVSWLA